MPSFTQKAVPAQAQWGLFILQFLQASWASQPGCSESSHAGSGEGQEARMGNRAGLGTFQAGVSQVSLQCLRHSINKPTSFTHVQEKLE